MAPKKDLIAIFAELRERDLLELVETIARGHRVTVAELLDVETRVGSTARHAVWFHIRDQLGWSYMRIGKLFRVDHSSVMYGVRRWRDAVEGAALAADRKVG
jgi:chromosomal replication initiation ATPase DnaA